MPIPLCLPLTACRPVRSLQTLRVPRVVSDQEGVQVEVTRLLVSSYFDIVRKNLQVCAGRARNQVSPACCRLSFATCLPCLPGCQRMAGCHNSRFQPQRCA